jgi:hypothetical protein
MYYTFFKTHMVIDTRRAIQTHTSGPGAPGGRTSNGIYGSHSRYCKEVRLRRQGPIAPP